MRNKQRKSKPQSTRVSHLAIGNKTRKTWTSEIFTKVTVARKQLTRGFVKVRAMRTSARGVTVLLATVIFVTVAVQAVALTAHGLQHKSGEHRRPVIPWWEKKSDLQHKQRT